MQTQTTPHGLLLINKASGCTSHDVVAQARRILNTKSVGHSGTLDPLASGLMVLLVGEATKLSQYILEQNKAYRVRAQLGIKTDTYDTTGAILEKNETPVPSEKVLLEAMRLHGAMTLPVPIFSAAKVDGKKLYEYAREGKDVVIPEKTMNFFDLKIENQGPDWIDVFMRCSKGSFIRAWVHLLGEKLGVGAAMSQLERTESMPYTLDQAVTLEELKIQTEEKNKTGREYAKGFIPMASTLPQHRIVRIKGQDEVMILNGLISHSLKNQLIGAFRPGQDEAIKIVSQSTGELRALVGLEEGKGFAIRRVFRYEGQS